jgi:hypothetical protein
MVAIALHVADSQKRDDGQVLEKGDWPEVAKILGGQHTWLTPASAIFQ